MVLDLKTRYEKRKKKLLKDSENNHKVFTEFLEWEERKLKRTNGLMELDNKCYKTLILYVHYFFNVEKWFNGKDWRKLTKKDIQKVYDNLEDGKILNKFGKPLKDKLSYYNKVFKSKPFEIVGKKELSKEVIEYTYQINSSVRFITKKDFESIVNFGLQKNIYKLLFWLMWDLGENVGSILQLRKDDFIEQEDSNGDKEYNVILRKDILKRSRTSRTIPINYNDTHKLLELVLPTLEEREQLFNFGTRSVEITMKRIVTELGIKCNCDDGKEYLPTPKDLRSGMTCHLLSIGWSTDEIKGRLGHNPSSRVIDRYASYLALNGRKLKEKVRENVISKFEKQIDDYQQKERLSSDRILGLQNEIRNIKLILEGEGIAV
jgi:hypothetical protein